ncbi:hypothetical protein J6590_021483 [Homalodisca vitripennis]|nr:hypothetical protein J6590_021483 [Homalodisca vitripennis]
MLRRRGTWVTLMLMDKERIVPGDLPVPCPDRLQAAPARCQHVFTEGSPQSNIRVTMTTVISPPDALSCLSSLYPLSEEQIKVVVANTQGWTESSVAPGESCYLSMELWF